MLTATVIAGVGVGPAALIGCNSSEPVPTNRKAASMPTPARVQPDIELLEPGAEPRRPLRYRLVAGAEETMSLRVGLSVETRADGAPVPIPETPAVDMIMNLRITDLDGPDQARYRFAVQSVEIEDAPDLEPETLAAMRQGLAGAAGMSGSARVDSRGFNWDVHMATPTNLDPMTRQMVESASQNMDQVSAPFPKEAVGQGAVWTLRQTIEQNGVSLDQETRFELEKLDDRGGVLTTRISQRAGTQPMPIPGLPPGAAELRGLESSGSGRVYFHLDQLVPRSSLSMRSSYQVTVNSEGAPGLVDTVVEMRIEIAPE
ncbi:hypothetical protein [Haliangium sp.]|uniref:hypothetical protein n=1 Tax=Haliangium sp. TaxID=2663208 RepID=UPI003D135645